MNWNTFQSNYPETANILPSSFMQDADDEHHLRRSIANDNSGYLDRVESLVKQTPASKIAQGSYQNGLTRKVAFSSFLAELKGYAVVAELHSPSPADVAGGKGLPDLECGNYRRKGFDVEVTRLSSWDKMANVQEEVEQKFDGTGYTPVVNYTNLFFVMPYTHKEIEANERFVSNIQNKIQNVNPSNTPSKIENYGIEIEVKKTGAKSGMISSTSVRRFPVDPLGSIENRLREKAEKQRGYRPLVVFIENRLSFLDPTDIKQIVQGTKYSSPLSVEPSSKVQKYASLWGEYMRDNGILPNPSQVPNSAIQDGDDGLFAENTFDRIAGVVFLDVTDECYYIPNFYTDQTEIRDLYEDADRVIGGLDFSRIV